MHTLLALLSSPWFSSKQVKKNSSVKLSWRAVNSLSWKWVSSSSLSSFLQLAELWYTDEGGDTQKCGVSALWKQDLPDSYQLVLDLTGVARQLAVLQRWRYVKWWWFTLRGDGTFNEIEIISFLSQWSFSTALQFLIVLTAISSSLLWQRHEGQANINDPTYSLKAWVNQKDSQHSGPVHQRHTWCLTLEKSEHTPPSKVIHNAVSEHVALEMPQSSLACETGS